MSRISIEEKEYPTGVELSFSSPQNVRNNTIELRKIDLYHHSGKQFLYSLRYLYFSLQDEEGMIKAEKMVGKFDQFYNDVIYGKRWDEDFTIVEAELKCLFDETIKMI